MFLIYQPGDWVRSNLGFYGYRGGQSCVKGAFCAAHRKGKGLRFPYLDKAVDGNVSEPGDVGDGPGKSSLFFLTARRPRNRIIRRLGPAAGKAPQLSRCPERHRRPLKSWGSGYQSCPFVLITASGLQGEQPLVDRTM